MTSDLFHSHLTHHKQYTLCNNRISLISPTALNIGVSQGSVRQPLMFLIHVNDFPPSTLSDDKRN